MSQPVVITSWSTMAMVGALTAISMSLFCLPFQRAREFMRRSTMHRRGGRSAWETVALVVVAWYLLTGLNSSG